MDKKRKEYIDSCEISQVESVRLGGYDQKIAIEGKKKDLPVIICLHGGPGSPVPFSVGCRGLFPEFTDRFIMVYWDQLGCGINNCRIENSFTVGIFAEMTADLIKLMKKRFPENKLYVFGMSWGSILALCAARKVPHLIDHVIVCGQVLSAPMFSDDAFNTIESSRAPEKYKKFVRNLRSSKGRCSMRDAMTLSKIIRKYTDGYSNHSSGPSPVGDMIKGLFSSPDYRFKDAIAVFINGYRKNESLFGEMIECNLRDELSGITVPYKIFQGDTDIVTDTKDVARFIDSCDNKNISYTILRQSGHLPGINAIKEIFNFLCGISSQDRS